MKVIIKINLLFSKLQRNLLFSIAIFLFLMKLAFDSLFYLTDSLYGPWALIWKFIISIPLIYIIFLFIFKDFREKLKEKKYISPEKYFSELLIVMYLLIAMIVLIIFLPTSIAQRGQINSIISLYITNITSFFAIFAGTYFVRFLYKWSLVHRHQKTKKYIRLLKYSFIIVFLFEIPNHFAYISPNSFKENYVFTIISGLVVLFFLAIMLVMTNRNSWIAVLPTGNKWKLILLGQIVTILAILIISYYSENSSESKVATCYYFFLGADSIFIWPLFLLLPYFLRILLSTYGTLPTSKIVERKASEVTSLSDLNRIVANTVDFEKLMDNVTSLAINASGAAGAWTEIYYNEGIKIESIKTILVEHIELLHKNGELKQLFLDINETYLVENISDHEKFSRFQWKNIPFAKSAIIVPLFSNKIRVGTLVALHQEEYGFEISDIEVMAAFASNVSMALDNARLMKDSIEKERLKRDLMLAREIQHKLLPQKLPKIANFEIAVFSEPAEEVGGDYYDLLELKNGNICIVIGDVSGKGISAAFYMAQLKGVVLAAAKESCKPADILKRINSVLFNSMEKNLFITLSALMLETETGKIWLSRAGHMPFLIFKDSNPDFLTPKGIGIGLANDVTFTNLIEEISYQMDPGEAILMFTDGLNELRNSEEKEFGLDKLKLICKNSVYKYKEENTINSADRIIRFLKDSIVEFSGNIPHHDDITALALVYRPDTV